MQLPDRIYIQFADNGNIRKWQREPFEEGTEFVAYLPPVDAEPVAATDPLVIIEGIKQFGLAADGADLRDLAAAIIALQGERDAQWKRADTLAQQNAYHKARAEAAEARVAELEKALESLDRMNRGHRRSRP